MQSNNVTVPDAGSSVQYITDDIGGWIYKVTTTIDVEQQNLADAQSKLAVAQQQLSDAQALIDALTPEVSTLMTSVSAQPIAPISLNTTSQEATSSPQTM